MNTRPNRPPPPPTVKADHDGKLDGDILQADETALREALAQAQRQIQQISLVLEQSRGALQYNLSLQERLKAELNPDPKG